MKLVDVDVCKEMELLPALRHAFMDEVAATDLYDRMIRQYPEYKEQLTEIRNDEINHQGKLLRLILQIQGDEQLEKFNEGLSGEE